MASAPLQVAHEVNKRPRTDDVLGGEELDFAGLLLSAPVLKGLQSAGFERPSPIQLKTIPLGRCGLDLIVQAKSGTGKTCVFCVIALESLILDTNALQVLVLAPTREIAVQIWEVMKTLGSAMARLRCYTFIGGLPVADDIPKLRKCHIAVGTPGRIKQLIEEGHMVTDSIRLFVLDEADKLMDESFQETINWIYSSLPDTKQMLALSATYPEVLAQHLTAYMCNPTFVRLNVSDPALLGIRQFYKLLLFHPIPHKNYEAKTKCLIKILSCVKFHQCLVFSNFQTRAESLCERLNARGWPSAFISGSQDQYRRLTAMAQLKKFKCRVLVSTDLSARGIDAENVNLVVNLDVPQDHETYLHRIGRAGRFGSYGAAISLACEGEELEKLAEIEGKCNTKITKLPDPIPDDLAASSGLVNWEEHISTEQLITQPHHLQKEDKSTACDGSSVNRGNREYIASGVNGINLKLKGNQVPTQDQRASEIEGKVSEAEDGHSSSSKSVTDLSVEVGRLRTEDRGAESSKQKARAASNRMNGCVAIGSDLKPEILENEVKKSNEFKKPLMAHLKHYLHQHSNTEIRTPALTFDEILHGYQVRNKTSVHPSEGRHKLKSKATESPNPKVISDLQEAVHFYSFEAKHLVEGRAQRPVVIAATSDHSDFSNSKVEEGIKVHQEAPPDVVMKGISVGDFILGRKKQKESRKSDFDVSLGRKYVQSLNVHPSATDSSQSVGTSTGISSESESDQAQTSHCRGTRRHYRNHSPCCCDYSSLWMAHAYWLTQQLYYSNAMNAISYGHLCYQNSMIHSQWANYFAQSSQQQQLLRLYNHQKRYIQCMAKLYATSNR